MPIPDSFTEAGYTKDTKLKVIKADGPFKVGDIVVLDEDNSKDWANSWAFFKNSAGYSGDMYFRGSRAEVEAIVDNKKEEQIENCAYPYSVSSNGEDYEYSVDAFGNYSYRAPGTDSLDTVGFWEEEEKQLSEDDESFPNIEVRTPHVAKIITYRVHFNEMYHRDLSEGEAVAIYQQLKELLGEK